MGGFISQGMQLDRFLQEAMQLANHLDMHHRIEEAYIFPLLAKKNPDFADMGRKSGGKSGEHIRKHRLIHKGKTCVLESTDTRPGRVSGLYQQRKGQSCQL